MNRMVFGILQILFILSNSSSASITTPPHRARASFDQFYLDLTKGGRRRAPPSGQDPEISYEAPSGAFAEWWSPFVQCGWSSPRRHGDTEYS